MPPLPPPRPAPWSPSPRQAAASRGARARAFVQHAECAQCHRRAGQMASRRPTAHSPVFSQESAEQVQARCPALGCWQCPRPGPSVSPADGRAVCPEHKCPGAAGWKGAGTLYKRDVARLSSRDVCLAAGSKDWRGCPAIQCAIRSVVFACVKPPK